MLTFIFKLQNIIPNLLGHPVSSWKKRSFLKIDDFLVCRWSFKVELPRLPRGSAHICSTMSNTSMRTFTTSKLLSRYDLKWVRHVCTYHELDKVLARKFNVLKISYIFCEKIQNTLVHFGRENSNFFSFLLIITFINYFGAKIQTFFFN